MNASFSSRFATELPPDRESDNRIRQVLGACFSPVLPTPVAAPKLVAYSPEVSRLLGFSKEEMQSEKLVAVLGGNQLLEGMVPHAACYGGHQFGNWAGQLGDGRAISLGERRGTDGGLWEMQLKGAGPTPYSRRADGRAVMRSSLREFLCSEAMHHLGIPTTRALSLVSTGETVVRDMLYDGNPREEQGAVVCRVAPSFIRFGNFEIFASRQDTKTLKALTHFTLRHFFPHLLTPEVMRGEKDPGDEEIASFFQEVCHRTAHLVTEWLRVGFVHGVMNTDNMSILGLTIDYGPYGFLDDFDPTWTPNTTDAHGRRYRFGQQPRVAEWNLLQLGNALLSLMSSPEPLERALGSFSKTLAEAEAKMMANKLGLLRLELDAPSEHGGPPDDKVLVDELMEMLTLVETDMTLFYRGLMGVPKSGVDLDLVPLEKLRKPLENAYYSPESLSVEAKKQIDAWLRKYIHRVRKDDRPAEERLLQMKNANPAYIFRNYLAQIAIDKAEAGDTSAVSELLSALRNPYEEQPGKESFSEKRPDWARNRPGCSMLSCSS